MSRQKLIKAEYAIVDIKHKNIDLLKNHIYSKHKAFREIVHIVRLKQFKT